MINNEKCIFCDVPDSEIYLQNDYAIARFDKFPVNPGHVLIIPKRHISNYFELGVIERQACWDLLDTVQKQLKTKFTADGFNIGVNVDEAAGQTIWHAHIHLIPRYKNDVDNPRGGVRSVIPDRKLY